jgi:hypothetical protein
MFNHKKLFALLALAILPAGAQTMERRAAIGNGQPGGPGKCTIEVVVDVSAEVQISGDRAVLRTLAGQPSQWRRFECSSVMPARPYGFRFAGVDGRGRQQLMADPSRNGTAVVRIDDQQSGSEGYTFDITWEGVGGATSGHPVGVIEPRRDGFDRDDRRVDNRGFDNRTAIRPYETQEAVLACEDAAIDLAISRYRAQNVVVRRSAIDDGPGRNDWVVGTLEARRGRDWDTYRFSCSVDFRARSMRSVNVDPTGPRVR